MPTTTQSICMAGAGCSPPLDMWFPDSTSLESVRLADDFAATRIIDEEDGAFIRACKPRLAQILAESDKWSDNN